MAEILGTPAADSLDGTPGNDTISLFGGHDSGSGRAGDDSLFGGAGDDLLAGSPDPLDGAVTGNDSYSGGQGDDVITDFDGRDTLFGGAGDDLLQTEDFDFGAGSVDDRLYGGDGDDILSAVGVLFGGGGDDSARGNGWLFGGAGNDFLDKFGRDSRLSGGAGDDVVLAINGSDRVDGGAGIDEVSYSSFTGPTIAYTIDLGLGTATSEDGVDLLLGIENATGASEADTLVGNGLANILSGEDGDDSLSGGDGNDALYGGFGNDLFAFESGDDLYDGGVADIDTVDYSAAGSAISMQGLSNDDVTVDQAVTTDAAGVPETDTLVDIERVIGTAFDDLMSVFSYGSDPHSLRHRLDGRAGNDSIFDGLLNDELIGGAGDDTLSFEGGGTDRASGGEGADRYDIFWPRDIFPPGPFAQAIEIADFARGEDRLSFTGFDASFERPTAAETFAALDSDGSGALDNGDAQILVGPVLVDGVKQAALTIGLFDAERSLTVTMLGVGSLTLEDFVDPF